MYYLRYLCFFAHSGVQRVLCCVFILVFFDYIVSFFGLPLRYSLTFIDVLACHHKYRSNTDNFTFNSNQ